MEIFYDHSRFPIEEPAFKKYKVAYQAEALDPSNYNVIPDSFDEYCRELVHQGHTHVCLDFETGLWNIKNPFESTPRRIEALRIAKYAGIVDISMFDGAPTGNSVYALAGGALEKKWHYWNVSSGGWALYADAVCPSLYNHWGDRVVWERFCDRVVAWARRYDKPVRPFISPRINGVGDLLSEDVWQRQLHHLVRYVGDVSPILWQGAEYASGFTGEEWWWSLAKDYALKGAV